MVKLIQLEYFLVVVESGSINHGAEKIYISQPSLSRTIKSLENELDVKLLTRTNSGVQVTPEGQLLYQHTLDILKRVDSLYKIKDQQLVLDKIKQLAIYNIFLDDQIFVKLHDCYNIYENTLENIVHEIKVGLCDTMVGVVNDEQLNRLKKDGFYIHIIDSGNMHIHSRKDNLNKNNIKTLNFLHLPYDQYSKENQIIKLFNFNTLVINSQYILLKYLRNSDSFILGHQWNIATLKQNNIFSFLIEDAPKQYLIVITRQQSKDYLDIINTLTLHYCQNE